MLVPDMKAVRGLLTRYASLRIALAERETPESARELEDVGYALCVMTGTRVVHEAVSAADALLAAEGPGKGGRGGEAEHGEASGPGRGSTQEADGENGLPVPA